MPNYVRTRLCFKGDEKRINEIHQLVEHDVTDKDGNIHHASFEFNTIIPMPEELDVISSSMGDDGMRYLILKSANPFSLTDNDRSFINSMEDKQRNDPDSFNSCIELGRTYLSNISKYNHKDWYGWRNDNWNTKWGACGSEWISDDIVEFETAWSFAYPIVEKLSQMFPDVEIEFEYADEDTSYNTGTGKFINGEEIDCEYPEGGSKRGYEIYLSLHPEYEDEIVYDKEIDNYIWVEDEDDVDDSSLVV